MRVAITGASGFLGRALLKRLTAGGADRIVAFSRDEQKRAALQREFGGFPGVRIYAGDVRDYDRLVGIFDGCEAVIHAAARKVVTGHPDEPDEMLKTNVLGTRNAIEAARVAGVKKFVLVSSDKAVHPVNVYGVSKAMAEHLAVMANARTFQSGLRIGAVRYGNVIGSTGSVVELWRKQLAAGEPVTVSDPDMTRFWLTIDDAVDLVLLALTNLRGGEIVIPNVGAASLRTLAQAVGVEPSSIAPISDVPMEGGGFAPRQGGEKLHEELVSSAESRRLLWRDQWNVYVVPPYQHGEMWDARPWLGELVAPGFTYRSDTWIHQLTVGALAGMVA